MTIDRNESFDVIVVGSGIAGLYAALLASRHRRVLLVTKAALEESNTRYAQGGIAVALDDGDSPELHLRDTLAAGDGLCDPHNVAILTREAPDCIRDLLRLGVPFDRDGDDLAFTLEAAHAVPRVLHAGGDATGKSIETTLASALRPANVPVWERALGTSLVLREGRIAGIRLFTAEGFEVEVCAPHVILATGGAGQLFQRTTNPPVATGDGLALAYRAGAQLMDLEFVQFHPTALVMEGAPSFLISEAVRGEGGVLKDLAGRAFMADYHADRELAPRDVVARAIHQQMSLTGSSHVWLDMTHLSPALIERRFPSIVRFCRRWRVDPVSDPIPVAPAAHYLMGGVRTDAAARTSVAGLLACGEVACTGVHGANRLASNSLLEGLVFARRAVDSILTGAASTPGDLPVGTRLGVEEPLDTRPGSRLSREEVARLLWRDASLVRSEESLLRVRDELRALSAAGADEPRTRDEYERENVVLLADLVSQAALLREESRGAHFRSDTPRPDPTWLGHIILRRGGAEFTPLAWPPVAAETHAAGKARAATLGGGAR